MKIDKITFKDTQAWIVFRDEKSGEYLGTWHTQDEAMVEFLRRVEPKRVVFYNFAGVLVE